MLGCVATVVLGLGALGIFRAHAQDRVTVAPPAGSALPELISGYYFLKDETKGMQDDDFLNPGMLWVGFGQEMWSVVEGEAGKSCQNCHDDAEETMKGVGASYPKYHEPWGKLINLEQRINLCRTENMKAPAWQWESDELLAMTAYVRHQSRGMSVRVRIDGPARPLFDKGKEFYYRRRGLFDMACSHCHDKYYGRYLRANWLSQGHTNSFPAYRLPWQRLGSLHHMFQVCNKRLRSEPYDYGTDEYVNLELYMAWRGSGLPVETPAVR
jgi:sulfur-oxidizing protein SoxA